MANFLPTYSYVPTQFDSMLQILSYDMAKIFWLHIVFAKIWPCQYMDFRKSRTKMIIIHNCSPLRSNFSEILSFSYCFLKRFSKKGRIWLADDMHLYFCFCFKKVLEKRIQAQKLTKKSLRRGLQLWTLIILIPDFLKFMH